MLSNIARGAVIDQPALIAALKEGKLRAAHLDVAVPEPLPSDDPLWDAPNIIITPHISAGSVSYFDRAVQLLIANLDRRRKGERLFNIVDLKKGY